MADRTVDLETDQRGQGDVDTPGPDGIVDDYDNAQSRLSPAFNGNISTKFPEDGRYDVVLDGCGSEGRALCLVRGRRRCHRDARVRKARAPP
jgi:hypothetical protein